MSTETMTPETRNQAIEALKIELTLVCVNPGKANIPRKQKGEPSVWQYTLTRNQKAISGPYTMGCGLREYANGRKATTGAHGQSQVVTRWKPIPQVHYGKPTEAQLKALVDSRPCKPTLADILYSLQSDASCASESFDDFCGDLGYDTDSRKALETYLACQKSGTDLRSLGLNLETLGELFQDY